jgi:hypothetical protein
MPTNSCCGNSRFRNINGYERDSIWHNDRIVSVAPGEIEEAPKIVCLQNQTYYS